MVRDGCDASCNQELGEPVHELDGKVPHLPILLSLVESDLEWLQIRVELTKQDALKVGVELSIVRIDLATIGQTSRKKASFLVAKFVKDTYENPFKQAATMLAIGRIVHLMEGNKHLLDVCGGDD